MIFTFWDQEPLPVLEPESMCLLLSDRHCSIASNFLKSGVLFHNALSMTCVQECIKTSLKKIIRWTLILNYLFLTNAVSIYTHTHHTHTQICAYERAI